jgi:hypothetical protein
MGGVPLVRAHSRLGGGAVGWDELGWQPAGELHNGQSGQRTHDAQVPAAAMEGWTRSLGRDPLWPGAHAACGRRFCGFAALQLRPSWR